MILHDTLLQKIKNADIAYYDNDNPIMSDEDYDNLRNEFITHFGKKELDYISGHIKKGLKPFKHPTNINSLDKIKFYEKEKLNKTIKKLYPVVLELKLDGLTIVAYPNGEFVTRGNGSNGEVLNNFPCEPNHSEYPIRGEAFLTQSDFEWINEQQKKQNQPLFANARNAAAGILRRLDKSPYLDKIQFLAYDVIGYDKSELDKLKYIEENTSFNTVSYLLPNCSSDRIIIYIEQMYQDNINKDIPIDGIVVKSNIEHSLEKSGSTVHHPLNAFAYKAQDEAKTTIIRDIKWQVGKECITPIAIFDPIQLEGTTVSQATLSNAGIAEYFDFHIGDTIMVIKSNKIIPKITQKIQSSDGEKLTTPSTCPSCGQPLTKQNTNTNSYNLICTNDTCKGKLVSRIEYMFSKKNINVKGLSEQTIIKLIDKGFVNKPTDIFNLTLQQIKQLDGFAEKSSQNLFNEIKSVKELPLEVFISSIGFIDIGINVGKLLAHTFHSYDKLYAILTTKSDLTFIDGIGEKAAKKLISDKFISEMEELRKYITPIDNEIETKNLSFVITGTLSKPRTEYINLIEAKGYKVTGTVTKKTNYLVMNDKTSTSTKANKARRLNIPIITEEELIKLLK